MIFKKYRLIWHLPLTHCLLKNLSISCWSQLCYKWLRVGQTLDSYVFGHHQQIRLSKWNLTPTNLTNKHLCIKVLFSGVEAIKFEEEFYKSDPIWLPHGKYLSTWLLCLSSWNKMAGQQSIFGHFSEWEVWTRLVLIWWSHWLHNMVM